MPTYVSLMNWTEQGIGSVRDAVGRERTDAVAQRFGARLERIYWTVGPYDLVGIIEAPDEESATAFLLEPGSYGNIRTTTLRAYDSDEMSRIIEKLGPAPGT